MTALPSSNRSRGGDRTPKVRRSDRRDRRQAGRALPLLILGAGVLGILFLSLISRKPEERPKFDSAPLVRVVEAASETYQFDVRSQGEVSPGREGDLIPQVSGEVLWISPAFEAGGFFEAGQTLVRIDPADYRVERATARAAVARAKSEFSRTGKDRDRQRRLAQQSVASQSRIDDAENAYRIAEASLREAEARLEKAERDLGRTELKAPYRGRVRSEQADLGQFVTRGSAIGRIYSVDYAEVRLPLPDRDLAYLDVPLVPQKLTLETASERNEAEETPARREPKVLLEANFAGERHRWEGALVRTEAELDSRSRMIHVVARVPDPYGLETERTAPLAVGLFVEASIAGAVVDDTFVLPRDALRENDQVYVIDAEGLLHFRDVEILRAEREQFVVRGGLEAGELVCVSPLSAAINGMSVRIAGETEAAAAGAPVAQAEVGGRVEADAEATPEPSS